MLEPVPLDQLSPELRSVVNRALESLSLHDAAAYHSALAELADWHPEGALVCSPCPSTPYAWAAWVLTATCRQALDFCYANSWIDSAGVAELIGLVSCPPFCSQRQVAGFLAVMAAGARGLQPPPEALEDLEQATTASLVVLAWLRSYHRLDLLL